MAANGTAPQGKFRGDEIKQDRLEELCRRLLLTIGEDPNRPGLAETPRRWAAWWKEFMEYDPGKVATVFESVTADQMVVVTGMRVYSLCEHHLLPFYCDISIGYIPQGQVLGLSKFARIAHKHAHGLQLQEQLIQQIADEIEDLGGSPHVAVLGRGEHLCMTMRGVETPAQMVTSVMRGRFRDLPHTRAEFLGVVNGTANRMGF